MGCCEAYDFLQTQHNKNILSEDASKHLGENSMSFWILQHYFAYNNHHQSACNLF